ncbi:MAG: diaminopimelate epimerase [Gemmataceae bacterium]|nr:diaminopimelate epimerase [Gemmataceae bacterium]
MRFTKMQGCGNDYIYVDCFKEKPPHDPPALSRAISDRHFGVGADGLILICPSERADARMRMFNADGSEAEMCGNGIRCLAKYVHDHGIATKTPLTIETGRGVLTLALEVEGGVTRRVRVDMGEPILDSMQIPTTFTGPRVVDQPMPAALLDASQRWLSQPWLSQPWLDDAGLDQRLTCVSMGNPHAVLFCRDVGKVPLESVGPVLETAAIFPRKCNIHFVQVHSSDEVTMRTWERGSGITLACGTGACAVCVAGALTGRTGRSITAHLPGGDLQLEWSSADQHVYMTGPAVEVFSGEWPA